MKHLAGRYQVGARLGGGAMADVFRAYDRRLGRDVALKVMRPALSVDPELVGRFDREAQVIARVAHPNVVAVTDHGAAGDEHFMAMELVDGPTLQQLLIARAPLGEEEATRIARDVAAGLAAAHDAGVIHRDLKPANILIAASGHALVSDFGIAHLEAMTQLTRAGEVLGTPRYIAPEQVTGGVDARSDVYSLGVVLYEMVVGGPPFDGESPLEIVRKHLQEKPVPPRRIVPQLSRHLEGVILKALQKDPGKRFSSAAALRDALRPIEAAPVAAFASRRSGVPSQHRTVGTAFASLGLLLTLTGVALAAVGPESLRGLAPAPASAAVASTATPAAARPTAPVTATTAPRTPSPLPTVRSTPAPTPTKVPATPARSAVAVPVANDAAAASVARFYDLVSAGRYDDAAALWSARMKAAYPPATNIYGRFASTRSISLTSWSIAAQSGAGATLNVEIKELMNDGTMRRWVGQWLVVNSGVSWLMDRPLLARV